MLVVAVIAVVLPGAFAAVDDEIPPPSGSGVLPRVTNVGGTNLDCGASYVADDHNGTTAEYQFVVVNPTNGTFTDTQSGQSVAFTISNIPASGADKGKFFDFSVSGGFVLDVGVKGGTDTAHYAYNGHVTSDTGLHATRQSNGKLYGLSHVTFCYDLVPTVTIDCSGDTPPALVETGTEPNTYAVQLGSGELCGKEGPREYVFHTFQQGATRVADFHPVDEAAGDIHLVERMTWGFTGTDQPLPGNRALKYDDDPSNGITPVPMPYCLKDPRVPGEDFALDPDEVTDVLPGTHTSCLLTSTERAGGTREDFAYSSVDGFRFYP